MLQTIAEEVSPPPYTLCDPHPPPSFPTAVVSARYTSHDTLLSGAEYFKTRPITLPCPDDLLSYRIRVSPTASPQNLPFPQPEHYLLERDVDHDDWTAFLSHLLPQTVRKISGGCQLSAQTFTRQKSICACVAEWNKDFFIPRGLRIVGDCPSCLCSKHYKPSEEMEEIDNVWTRSPRLRGKKGIIESKVMEKLDLAYKTAMERHSQT